MKDLKDMLNESLITEASTQWRRADEDIVSKGADIIHLGFRGKKKYGFLSWLVETEKVELIAADSAQELADAFSIDDAAYVDQLFNMKVGECVDEGGLGEQFTMRIW